MDQYLQQVQALSQLGATGILITFFILVLRRKVITKGEKDDSDAALDVHLDEVRAERDEWKHMAQDSLEKVGRLTDALESQNEIYERLAK